MKRQQSQEQKSNLIRERDIVKERYELITNYHIFDKRLSIAQKGFLTMLYCLPEKWKITTKATSQYFNISEPTFIKYIKELEEIGYIEKKKINKNKINYIVKYRPSKAPFDIINIKNYTLEQLHNFLNDARIKERYKALIKKFIETATKTNEHFNKMLEEIDKETKKEQTTAEPLPFE